MKEKMPDEEDEEKLPENGKNLPQNKRIRIKKKQTKLLKFDLLSKNESLQSSPHPSSGKGGKGKASQNDPVKPSLKKRSKFV